ncbi:MAG: ABC transporter permease subunit, partial [Bdellovibrionota bacterium]
MESLIRSRSRLSPALTTLVSIFVLLPLVLFIVDAVFRFEISSLTSIFFQLLLRSVVFGFFQALISASLSLVLAFGLSLWLLSLAPELRMRLIALVRPLGQLLFVLPGTAIALLVLALPTFFLDGLEGMGLIVSAHVLWSVFFVATHVFERLNDWLEAEGADLLRASKSLGASPWQSVRSVVFPLLKNETRTWFPLIFLWSFGAFSTVLLLGSGPQHSTPEVLLYYTLINDVESARLLVVFAFTLALQLLLLKVFSSRARFDDETLRLQSPSSLNIERHEKFSLPQSSLFAFVSLALLLATLALIVTQIVAIISAGMPDPSLWSGLVNTWLYAFLATLFALLLFFLAAASSSETRRLLVFLFALSPVLLATSWSR